VRHGKAMRGSPAKQRTVLTVFDWAAEAFADWAERALPRYGRPVNDLFPTEKGGLVPERNLWQRMRTFIDELGFPTGLDPSRHPHLGLPAHLHHPGNPLRWPWTTRRPRPRRHRSASRRCPRSKTPCMDRVRGRARWASSGMSGTKPKIRMDSSLRRPTRCPR